MKTRSYYKSRAKPRRKNSIEYDVLVIGDTHDSPTIDKKRFRWMGRYAALHKCDFIVQIGDFATFESLTTYIPNDTYEARTKPIWQEDLKSLEKALAVFDEGCKEINKSYKPRKDVTLGNHEYRIWRFENKTPEVFGILKRDLFLLLSKYNWTIHEYGDFLFIGGVGFTHAPFNELGKEYGGKTAEQRIANDAIFDIVFGHSHKDKMFKASKIGGNNYVRVLNVGCALPYGHVEDYARHSTTGWSWGIYQLHIQDRHIQSWRFVSMNELERNYN